MAVISLSDASIKSGGKRTTFWDQTTAWNEGLQLISTQSFSSVSTVEFDNVFSDKYVQYKVIGAVKTSGADAGLHLRFRTGGSNNTSSIYNIQQYVGNGSSQGGVRYTSQTYWFEFLGIAKSSFEPVVITELMNPYQTTYTSGLKMGGMNNETASIQHDLRALGTNATTSFDGFAIIPSAAVNLTGTISVYGYYKGE